MSKGQVPRGIRFSAGLLIVVNYLAAMQLIASFLLESSVLFLKRQQQSLNAILLTYLTLAGGAAFVWISIKAVYALRAGQRWGAYIAFVWAAFFFVLTYELTRNLNRLSSRGGDGAEAILIFAPLAAVGLWWCTYLNLPHVLYFFKR